MTKIKEIYKCNVCGNITEVLQIGIGELVCCGQPMENKIERKEDEGQEKHVPVIEKTDKGIMVKIGGVPHPMEDGHYIEWVEVIGNNFYCRKFLKPGDKPEVEFDFYREIINAREYCNIHGLWGSK